MDRLGTLDAAFYFAESAHEPLHVGAAVMCAGPAPGLPELRRAVGRLLDGFPRYRRRVREAPPGRPYWEDHPGFDVRAHVDEAGLPPGETGLTPAAVAFFEAPLDLSVPPWRMRLLTGLADGRWALLAKAHHCAVDGVGGIGLLVALFGEDGAEGRAPEWVPQRRPGRIRTVAGGVADALRSAVAPPVRFPSPGPGPYGAGLARMARSVRPSALPDPKAECHYRSWEAFSVNASGAGRAMPGPTLNDLVLGAATAGYREFLQARRLPLADVTCVVPVSVRDPGADAGPGNRVSAVLLDLPCAEPDPRTALAAIQRRMTDLKNTRQARTGQILLDLAGRAPFLLPAAVRASRVLSRPVLRTVVTNIPGPADPLRLLGRDVLELYPYVPIGAGTETSIAVVSYRDRLHFGVTGLRTPGPGIPELSRAIASAWHTLTAPPSR
ncbi:diacyglycerol O-acyltransferase [Actinocorallia aurea]